MSEAWNKSVSNIKIPFKEKIDFNQLKSFIYYDFFDYASHLLYFISVFNLVPLQFTDNIRCTYMAHITLFDKHTWQVN